jgi:fructosamine-3-kinase
VTGLRQDVVVDSYRKQVPAGSYGPWEATGLAWLAAAEAVKVVPVLAVGPQHLDLLRLHPVPVDLGSAEALGRGLAQLHDAGASAFGAAPPGWSGDGWFGPASSPLPLDCTHHETWGRFYAGSRIEPVAAALDDAGLLPSAAVTSIDLLLQRLRAGRWDDDDAPARLHGDLWSGNVVCTPDGPTLIDPAAHGGHRETDLAMLALFGFPYLDQVVAAYQAVHPLVRGWKRRQELHQLYPLAVHALLFGGSYVGQTCASAARLATV